MAARLPKIITAEWALNQEACPTTAREFAEKWPNGLELTRKNLRLVRRYFAHKQGYIGAGWAVVVWLEKFIPTTERRNAYHDGEVTAYLKRIHSNTRRADQKYSQTASNLMADALGLP